MITNIDDKDDEEWSEAIMEKTVEIPNINPVQVSTTEIAQPQLELDTTEKFVHFDNPSTTDEISSPAIKSSEGKIEVNKATDAPKILKSDCHPRSRNTRGCQKHLQEVIGKHEVRNEELEQREGDLRKRLEALECLMPAAMVGNIWKKAQGAPTSAVIGLIEKQLKGCDGENVGTTPSKHWDERVRKIEAERKEAVRRAEEARILLAEKEATMEERRKRLEDAKKCNLERKEKMEMLAREAAVMRESLKNARGDDNSCTTGDCGEIRCRDRWLENLDSISSLGSTDLECFGKLQELAEAEICMRRQITELERREGAYMRTLQHADEIWSVMEGDSAVTVNELKDQLNSKSNANQQLADRICQLEDELENVKMKHINCTDELKKFIGKEHKEVIVGLDDDEATVKDRATTAAVKTATVASVTSAYAFPPSKDQEISTYPDTKDIESSTLATINIDASSNTIKNVLNKSSEALPIVDRGHQALDPITILGVDSGVGDEENIPEHWKNHDWDQGCPPDNVCNDLVDSSTGTEDVLSKAASAKESNIQATTETGEKIFDQDAIENMANVHTSHITAQTGKQPDATEVINAEMATAVTIPKSEQILVPREELHNWYNIVDSTQNLMAKSNSLSLKTDDIAQLAERMKIHLRIKSVAGVKKPVMTKKILREPTIVSEGASLSAMTSSPAVSVDRIRNTENLENPLGNIPGVGKTNGSVQIDPALFDDLEISEKAAVPEVLSDIDSPTGVSSMANISASKVPTNVENVALETSDDIPDSLIPHPDLVEEKSSIVDKEPATEKVPSLMNIEVESIVLTPVKDSVELNILADKAEPPADLGEEPVNVPDVLTEIQGKFLESVEEIASIATVEKPEFFDGVESPAVLSSQLLPSQHNSESGGSNGDAEEKTIIQAPRSYVTLRTPPPSKTDVTPDIKTPVDLTDEFELALDDNDGMVLKEDVNEDVEGHVSTIKDVTGSQIKEMPELVRQVSDPKDFEDLKQQATIINSIESLEFKDETSATQEDATKVDSIDEPKIPETRSPPDVMEISQSPSKARDSMEEKRRPVANQPSVEKPYTRTEKVESSEKLVLPKPGVLCICTPLESPLVNWNAAVQAELKDLSESRVVTGKTEIKPLIPKNLSPGRPNECSKTIGAEDHTPCQVFGKWRRSKIWSKLPKDKSTLTCVCVDTQTDSKVLARKKTMPDEINRKDDCTCSGVSPITAQPSNSVQQIAKPPSHNVTELFGLEKLLASTTSGAEKSFTSRDVEIRCVECGRPMTREETCLPKDSNLVSESQKNVISSLKRLTRYITRQDYDSTCCQCKKSRKDKSPEKSKHRRENKKHSENDVCCPCPTKTSKKAPKYCRSKRKPETKDQGVGARIPRDKVPKKRIEDVDTKSEVLKSNIDLESYCECEEFTNDGNITEGEIATDALDGTSKGDVSCDCLLKESISRGSNCNCVQASTT